MLPNEFFDIFGQRRTIVLRRGLTIRQQSSIMPVVELLSAVPIGALLLSVFTAILGAHQSPSGASGTARASAASHDRACSAARTAARRDSFRVPLHVPRGCRVTRSYEPCDCQQDARAPTDEQWSCDVDWEVAVVCDSAEGLEDVCLRARFIRQTLLVATTSNPSLARLATDIRSEGKRKT